MRLDVFFRVLTVYFGATQADWRYLSMLGKIAAHDLWAQYNPCSDALAQQETIQKAFGAVGHPGDYPDNFICANCGCIQ